MNKYCQTIASWVAAVMGLGILIDPSYGSIIDNFIDFPQLAEQMPSGANVTPDEVTLSQSLFMTRSIAVSRGVQRLQVTGGGIDYDVFEPPPDYSDIGRGYFHIDYSSSTPVSLLGDGATSVRIMFDRFSAPYPYILDVYFESTGVRQDYPIQAVRGGIDTPTAVDIPFSVFDQTDFGSVDGFGIDAARFPIGASLRISGISTVPEPSTAMLFVGGVLVWCFGMRRLR